MSARLDMGEVYVRSIQNAYAEGRVMAEEPDATEAHCRFRRYEQRKSWLDGFRERRAELAGER